MLKIVRSSVMNEKSKPFGQFYTEYIMKVQDENIDREVNKLIYSSRNSVKATAVLIDTMWQEMLSK